MGIYLKKKKKRNEKLKTYKIITKMKLHYSFKRFFI